jgi:aspartate kinase
MLDEIKNFHLNIARSFFSEDSKEINIIKAHISELEAKLDKPPSLNFNFEYDQIVSYGEILSTSLISEYLNSIGIENKWIDIRMGLKTDNTYRESKVDWELSSEMIKKQLKNGSSISITQGFIGSTINNLTTTLGREGSDYSAAILAYILSAKKLTIWKDVPGVLNADPKYFEDTVKLEKISYLDAIELAYYGTSVIHPKTIQPLKNKKIPLEVRSFLEPDKTGTIICEEVPELTTPCYIFKMDQVLLQIYPKDFSFIAEDNLITIFNCFAKYGLKINLMQNSAVSFNVCVNNDKTRVPSVITELQKDFKTSYEKQLELITIRHYDEATTRRIIMNKDLLLTQKTSETVQMVVKDFE